MDKYTNMYGIVFGNPYNTPCSDLCKMSNMEGAKQENE